jgi:dihydroorotate dehydrogenase electron transfer subunit
MSNKGIFNCAVLSNKQIGEHFYKLRLEFTGAAAEVLSRFTPGQFVQIDVSTVALPPAEKIPEHLRDSAHRSILLRRPFSFADVTAGPDRTTAELVYSVLGPATLRMTTLSAGHHLSVIGPLGNGFTIPQGKKLALLAIGGMGAPPLQYLAKVLSTEHIDIEIMAFVGAKTTKDLPFERRLDSISQSLGFAIPEFAKYGINSMIATDDGSAGYHGFVTDCLKKWLSDQAGFDAGTTIIYACGPEPMLATVTGIAKDRRIDCQVSTEQLMACGIGLCQSCAVECRIPGSSETTYKLCCEDGPVFDGREVVFNK